MIARQTAEGVYRLFTGLELRVYYFTTGKRLVLIDCGLQKIVRPCWQDCREFGIEPDGVRTLPAPRTATMPGNAAFFAAQEPPSLPVKRRRSICSSHAVPTFIRRMGVFAPTADLTGLYNGRIIVPVERVCSSRGNQTTRPIRAPGGALRQLIHCPVTRRARSLSIGNTMERFSAAMRY